VDRSFEGLIFSLIIHALLVWALWLAPKVDLTPAPSPTEIVLVETATKKSKSFVMETERQESLRELKDSADLLSQFTKRVKKQMKARESGPTVNAGFEPPTPQPQAQVQPPEPGGIGAQSPAMRHLAIGRSTIGEHIPGVEEGAFTALNTDQFTYYSFFARIGEQIRNRWVANVREYVSRLSQAERETLSKSDRNTVIEIVLNPQGHYTRSLIHQTSGDRRLDQTTLQAFQDAAPFLNPPRGLIEADGFIHLKYAFVVRFRPPSFGPDLQ